MQELIKGRLEGLYEPMKQFDRKLDAFRNGAGAPGDLTRLIREEMEALDLDSHAADRFDNVIGAVKGNGQEQDMALVFPIDYRATGALPCESGARGHAGIVTALYAAAVLKRTLLPLSGDLLVCGVPRSECCEFGVKYLFEYFLRKRIKKLKGIILCEPTDMNLYLGHKGRMEYEIVVKVRLSEGFMASRGINMLGTMFPLIHELEALSHTLPSNNALGSSSLKIKDVHFCGTQPRERQNEFRVIVDRTFVPEEQQENILERAKMIAQSVYRSEPDVLVQTAVTREKIRTFSGSDVVSEKEIRPWTMDSIHPFVLNSLQALRDNGFKPDTGYWKHTMTEGAYTFGELGIPTFGFGPGAEASADAPARPAGPETLKKAVHGLTMMIHRAIGVPTFGWTSDEI